MQSILSAVKIFKRQAAAREAAAVGRLLDAFNRLIVPSLLDDIGALIAILVARGGTLTPRELRAVPEYIFLLNQIERLYNDYGETLRGILPAEYLNMLELGALQAVTVEALALQIYVGIGADFETFFGLKQADAIRAIIAAAGETGPLGALLVKRFGAESAQAFTDALIKGIARGSNPRVIAAQMVRELKTGMNKSLLIARDQMIRAHRNGTFLRYQDSKIVTGYRRLAAHNTRTCIACLMLDGKLYPTSELMPLHPQDRCSMVPVFTIGNHTYDAYDGKNGKDYFNSLSGKQQREILGDSRYNLWNSGRVSLEDMIETGEHPVWGATVNIKSIYKIIR